MVFIIGYQSYKTKIILKDMSVGYIPRDVCIGIFGFYALLNELVYLCYGKKIVPINIFKAPQGALIIYGVTNMKELKVVDKTLFNPKCHGIDFIEVFCKKCPYFTYQKDHNNDIAITFCTHESNPEDKEGNTLEEFCPPYRANQL